MLPTESTSGLLRIFADWGKEEKMNEGQTNPPNSAVRSDSAGISWINTLLGIWVIISPFVLGFALFPVAMWNNVATGGAVAILALIRSGAPRQTGLSWVNVLLGIWLIISPFALGMLSGIGLWNNIILGIIITIVAWGNAAATVRAPA
jgi:SPW repeat